MQNWIVVASAEHVRKGRSAGFMQVCHGKQTPLRRMKPNDWLIYYSPTLIFGGKDKLQSFTAIGQITEREPYQIDMGNGFCPFRRDVLWFEAQDTPISLLLNQLDLTKNKKNWGYSFRFGLIAISEHDRQLISRAMKVTTEGIINMQSIPPTLKHIASFKVTGFSTTTQNRDEFNEKTAKIPKLWKQFHSSGLATNLNIFGVYSDYESDANGPYTATVGIASDEPQTQFNSVQVQTSNYLVFQGKGPMPSTVIETWTYVWSYFEKTTEYHRNFISDFEAYNGPDEVAIYIGVK